MRSVAEEGRPDAPIEAFVAEHQQIAATLENAKGRANEALAWFQDAEPGALAHVIDDPVAGASLRWIVVHGHREPHVEQAVPEDFPVAGMRPDENHRAL